jgi:hypothetical protein
MYLKATRKLGTADRAVNIRQELYWNASSPGGGAVSAHLSYVQLIIQPINFLFLKSLLPMVTLTLFPLIIGHISSSPSFPSLLEGKATVS